MCTYVGKPRDEMTLGVFTSPHSVRLGVKTGVIKSNHMYCFLTAEVTKCQSLAETEGAVGWEEEHCPMV